MSWDVSIHKFSRQYTDISEIPKDEKPLPLGSLAYVHEQVLNHFPGTDWSDQAWGVWSSNVGSIEFNLGREDPADGLMLHVRASQEVVPAIVNLCCSCGWQGIDCSSGDFIEQSEKPESGLSAWRKYRDQIISGHDA